MKKTSVCWGPLFVIFTLNLGASFGFPISSNEISLDHLSLAFIRIKNYINDYGTMNNYIRQVKQVFKKVQLGNIKPGRSMKKEIISFTEKSFTKTKRFMRNRSHLLISSADKGGKVVVTL